MGRTRNMPRLTVDKIAEAKDAAEEIVDVPEWGGSVKVRTYSLRTANQLDQLDGDDWTLAFLKAGISEPELDDDAALALLDKSKVAGERVMAAILRCNTIQPAKAADAAFQAVPAGGTD